MQEGVRFEGRFAERQRADGVEVDAINADERPWQIEPQSTGSRGENRLAEASYNRDFVGGDGEEPGREVGGHNDGQQQPTRTSSSHREAPSLAGSRAEGSVARGDSCGVGTPSTSSFNRLFEADKTSVVRSLRMCL